MKNTTEFLKDVFITSIKIDFIVFRLVLAAIGLLVLAFWSWKFVLACTLVFCVAYSFQVFRGISRYKQEHAKKELERLRLEEQNKVRYVIIK